MRSANFCIAFFCVVLSTVSRKLQPWQLHLRCVFVGPRLIKWNRNLNFLFCEFHLERLVSVCCLNSESHKLDVSVKNYLPLMYIRISWATVENECLCVMCVMCGTHYNIYVCCVYVTVTLRKENLIVNKNFFVDLSLL